MTTKSDAPADSGAPQAPPAPQTDGAPAAPPAGEQPQENGPTIDYKALAEKWERQAKNDRKSLDGLKQQLQGVLTPEQAEQTKRTAEQAEKDANDARLEAMRLRIALRTSLPEEWADRLRGDTEEALVADAKNLAKYITPMSDGAPPKPGVPDAGAGTGRREKPQKPELNDLLRTMAGL